MSSSNALTHPLLREIRDKNTALTPDFIELFRRSIRNSDDEIARHKQLLVDFRTEIWCRICAEHPRVHELCSYASDGSSDVFDYCLDEKDAVDHHGATFALIYTNCARGPVAAMMVNDVLSGKLVLKN